MPGENGDRIKPYDEADLAKLLEFAGELHLLLDGCSYLHPGDIRHHLSNVLHGRGTGQYIQLYEEEGRLLGLIVVYPPNYFDLLLHPTLHGGEVEAGLISWGERHVRALMTAAGAEQTQIGTDVLDCDTTRRDLLLAQGWAPDGEPSFWIASRSLLAPLPAPSLPEGFAIRSATGEHEAEALGVVHSSAFNSDWSNNAYLEVMRCPAYDMSRELVVVAPDGRLAAFLIYWPDPVSKSALFEPVGCHKDFQRRGLTKALMYEAMRRMCDEGMLEATVKHQPPETNPAAAALYASVGLHRRHTIAEYHKL